MGFTFFFLCCFVLCVGQNEHSRLCTLGTTGICSRIIGGWGVSCALQKIYRYPWPLHTSNPVSGDNQKCLQTLPDTLQLRTQFFSPEPILANLYITFPYSVLVPEILQAVILPKYPPGICAHTLSLFIREWPALLGRGPLPKGQSSASWRLGYMCHSWGFALGFMNLTG